VTTTDTGKSGYESPDAIRNETFPRRMRGLDTDAVYEYLDRLADQIEVADRDRREVRTENERLRSGAVQLRGENERLQGELQRLRAELAEFEGVGDRVNEQVVKLFSQAQLVAEEMVEDVTRDARERLGHARAQERQIVEQAVSSAGEEVRSYAQAATLQMQSIMESFSSQVTRLGDVPSSDERPR